MHYRVPCCRHQGLNSDWTSTKPEECFQSFPSKEQESGQIIHWLLFPLVESCLQHPPTPLTSHVEAVRVSLRGLMWLLRKLWGKRETGKGGGPFEWDDVSVSLRGPPELWLKCEWAERTRWGAAKATGGLPVFPVGLSIERSTLQCQGSLKVQTEGTGEQKSSLVFKVTLLTTWF